MKQTPGFLNGCIGSIINTTLVMLHVNQHNVQGIVSHAVSTWYLNNNVIEVSVTTIGLGSGVRRYRSLKEGGDLSIKIIISSIPSD